MDEPKQPIIVGPDGRPPTPPVFRDADGNVVPASGGPRVRLPEALAKEVMAAPLEERAALVKKIVAHRAKQRAEKRAKATALATRTAKRRAKNKTARKQRRG